MVNGRLLYGVELSTQKFLDILENNGIKEKYLRKFNFVNENSDNKNDDNTIIFDKINKKLSLATSPCQFKENSSCCCKNDKDGIIFFGWISEPAWTRGDYSGKINMMTSIQKTEIEAKISQYIPNAIPSFFIATAECDFCT